MVSLVDIAAGDVINIDFMHLMGHERPLISTNVQKQSPGGVLLKRCY